MIETIYSIHKKPKNNKKYWEILSKEMIAKGFTDFDANKCEVKYNIFFNNYYEQVFDCIEFSI